MVGEQWQDLIAGYVLGNLSAEEAVALWQLLEQHPSFQADLEQMQTILERVYNPPSVAPPSSLKDRILAQQRPLTAPPTKLFSKPTSANISAPWWAPLGAALVVFLGLNNLRLWQELELAQSTAPRFSSVATLTVRLDPTPNNPRPSASAEVLIDSQTLQAFLKVENLPHLSPDEVYVLWTVIEEGAPFTVDHVNAILTTVFEVDEQGNASRTIDLPPPYRALSQIKALAITQEDAAAPNQHLGSPLMFRGLNGNTEG